LSFVSEVAVFNQLALSAKYLHAMQSCIRQHSLVNSAAAVLDVGVY